MAITTHRDVLAGILGDPTGRDLLDVGCGSGELVRWFRSLGARAVGAECGTEMLRRARAADPDHMDDYVDAPGEALPFADSSIDVVVYSYSLHHVPIDSLRSALAEARRVLRRGGTLIVIEPAVEPADRAIAAAVVDEHRERTAAQHALDSAADVGLELVHREVYETENSYPDFETWEDGLVGVDPARAAAMDLHRSHARENFDRIAEHRGDRYVIRRTNLLAVLRA